MICYILEFLLEDGWPCEGQHWDAADRHALVFRVWNYWYLHNDGTEAIRCVPAVCDSYWDKWTTTCKSDITKVVELYILIMMGSRPYDVFQKYATLTGTNELPPVSQISWRLLNIIYILIMMGPRPYDVFQQYATLTGTNELPPVSQISRRLLNFLHVYW